MSTVSPSKSLVSVLNRTFSANDVALVVEFYGNSITLDDQEERSIHREKGVSFNPRPCRICEILITLCDTKDSNILTSALTSCSNYNVYDSASDFSSHVDSPFEPVMNAILLDTLRHLHLSSQGHEAKVSFVERVRDYVTLISSNQKIQPYLLKALANAKL